MGRQGISFLDRERAEPAPAGQRIMQEVHRLRLVSSVLLVGPSWTYYARTLTPGGRNGGRQLNSLRTGRPLRPASLRAWRLPHRAAPGAGAGAGAGSAGAGAAVGPSIPWAFRNARRTIKILQRPFRERARLARTGSVRALAMIHQSQQRIG